LSRNSTTRARAARNRFNGKSDGACDYHQIVHDMIALYGDCAPTAVAWCAFEAWCECEEEEYQFWLGIFHRLRN
jgi:hypothetical protein